MRNQNSVAGNHLPQAEQLKNEGTVNIVEGEIFNAYVKTKT